MGLSTRKKDDVKEVLKKCLRDKFANYSPETSHMPFHTRLLGKDRLALYSFIHSLNTAFGTSIFEPVAVVIAKDIYKEVKTHVKAGDTISEKSLYKIQEIMDNLTAADIKPDKDKEIAELRLISNVSPYRDVKPTVVDIFLKSNNNEIYLIDIKTAKPNKGGFKEFKRTLLEWVAVSLVKNPHQIIHTLIAIPYNPYEPKPYSRWTMAGMLDLEKELKVGKEFWDFLGGIGAYEDLLDCFEQVGIELRSEIDDYFSTFNR